LSRGLGKKWKNIPTSPIIYNINSFRHSVIADASGGLLSSMRYTAFGEIRAASGSTSTDYRYTGQRSEAEIGLYYYVARFYDPALGRFISADSIVPGAENPMAWDRYSYVRNNPINLTDPSGNKACSSDGNNFDSCTDPLSLPTDWETIEKDWGIKFEGSWAEQRKTWVLGGVVGTGRRIAAETGESATKAFQTSFASINPQVFLFGTDLPGYNLSGLCSGIDSGGCTSYDKTNQTRIINFWNGTNQYHNGALFIRNVVHELGHVFNSINSNSPVTALGKADLGRGLGGYAGKLHQWQFNESDTPSENFADMFVGWTYDRWSSDKIGDLRSSFMNNWMPYYLMGILGQ
jgi:RHS repeat-associated protein